jgi:GLPGLI family protein
MKNFFVMNKSNQRIFIVKIIILLYCFPVYSQNKEYSFEAVYTVTWQTDSLNISSKKTLEDYSLLINNNSSLFVSKNKIYRDSLANTGDLSVLAYLSSVPKSSSNELIFKSNNSIKQYENISSLVISSEDKFQINWQLTNDTLTIGGIACKKAVTDFRGRKFEAWYSEEIPISEGPYKFYGLPGLIISIGDTKGHISYSLVRFRKLKKPISYPTELLEGAKNMSLKDYNKVLEDYLSNPIRKQNNNNKIELTYD